MAAGRVGTSMDSEDVPQTAEGGEPTTAQTPSSVHEDSRKAGTGRMPLTSEGSVSQVEGSKKLKGQMSAARDSAESDRPARKRPASGSEDRLSMLQREDAEEFGPPTVRSFEEDALLKRPPPDFGLGQEHWLGLQVYIREKLWRMYRLDNPLTMEDEESYRMEEVIARARKERSEKMAREVFEREYASKKEDLQSRPDEAARRMWDDDHTRQRAEERIAEAEARIKELRAEAIAASRSQRETFDQYRKLCQEWRAEEMKSRRKCSGAFHQDLVLEPVELPDLPPSVRHSRDSKLAEPQRLAAPPPTNTDTSRTGLSAWVGSTSERRTAARRTPQPRGLRVKKLIAFRVGEGVSFSDCYRSFRKVVHDATRETDSLRQTSTSFN